MKKVLFDIKYKEKIINGSAKVFHGENPVRIICWDRKGDYPIVGLRMDGSGSLETVVTISEDGHLYIDGLGINSCPVHIYMNDDEKFDFTKLKAFTPVLARNGDNQMWLPHFFESFHPQNRWGEFYMIDDQHPLHRYSQCVPYDGNEHLLMTNDPIPECYKLKR